MRKQTIQYTSPVDALIAVTKRLSIYESQQKMDSEAFFDRYSRVRLNCPTTRCLWTGRTTVTSCSFAQELAKSLPAPA